MAYEQVIGLCRKIAGETDSRRLDVLIEELRMLLRSEMLEFRKKAALRRSDSNGQTAQVPLQDDLAGGNALDSLADADSPIGGLRPADDKGTE